MTTTGLILILNVTMLMVSATVNSFQSWLIMKHVKGDQRDDK